MSRQRKRRQYRRRHKMLAKIFRVQQKHGVDAVRIIRWSGYKRGLVVTVETELNHKDLFTATWPRERFEANGEGVE